MARVSTEALSMRPYQQVVNVRIENGMLCMDVDGQATHKPLGDISACLAKASDAELNHFEISPSGYGIHWPLIDEDISIDGLLGILHRPAQWEKTA
jgi:hypothetical protein